MADQVRGAGVHPEGLIRPMLAVAGAVPTSAGWAFEVKFDGVRAIGYAGGAGLTLYSRNDRDITSSYPEISGIGLGDGLVIDGELVSLDARGRSDFGRLQHRMHVVNPPTTLMARVPVQYVVFDVLRHRGRPVVAQSYSERRALLATLDLAARVGLQVPANFTGIAGAVVLDAVDQQGLEGVVAKRADSAYLPGRRSRSWIKTAIRHTQDVVVIGWSGGSGNRRNFIGALVLGAYDGDQLVYVGEVGTGFSDVARARLLEQLSALARSDRPFGGGFARARGWPGRAPGRGEIHWVEPRLVGEIEYRSFTADGFFRHASWRGLRPDRDPHEVQLPPPT